VKQIIQDLNSGETILEEIPVPIEKDGYVLIKTTRSLVSLGTERSLVEFGKAGLVAKAKQQPEKVKMVLDKFKSDGIVPTLEAVFNKLNQPLPLGYCNVGKVVAIGNGVEGFKIGDRVISNGAHAEYVNIPKNLVAKIPDDVSDDEAAFTVIGSIGLQGVRLIAPTFGETIVVVGLGLIGLLTAQILKANGCNVIGIDFDDSKLELAKTFGLDVINPSNGVDQVKYVEQLTGGIGADGVIITASTSSDEVISNSARMCRKRGRVVLVGVIGLNISRADFYEKEINFQVSCSYGPGRYDENYEQLGNDYPIGFVRWTQKRNFESILNAIENKSLQVQPLITQIVDLENYNEIYGDIGKSKAIASILKYSNDETLIRTVKVVDHKQEPTNGTIGVIGAGNFTNATFLPIVKNLGLNIKYIASSGGLSAKVLAKKSNIVNATSDYQEILKDPDVDLVVITTRHNMHFKMVIDSIKANKQVFVEKPLCLNKDELDEISRLNLETEKNIVVGFNRRFAPMAMKMRDLIGNAPANIVATMNAGEIPTSSWVQSMEEGGGRIIGEGCHFIDLCSYLANSKVISVCANTLGLNPQENCDNVSIMLKFENGSNAVINYFSNGSKSYSKERVEVYSLGKTLVMDNWRTLKGYGYKNFSSLSNKQDKGHRRQFQLMAELLLKGGQALIPFDSIRNTTLASFAAVESFKNGNWVNVE
tara:strand:+ start:15402 stop:17516 length:2115 start_codon:yes stop_codon:yes gene_type:complete